MQRLNDCELANIEGGAIKKSLLIGLAAFGVLLAGIIDGYKPQCLHKRV